MNTGGTFLRTKSSPNPSKVGQTSNVHRPGQSQPPETGSPTGTVTFKDGTNSAKVTLVNGSASFSTSTLTQGTHTITVSYSGDKNFNPELRQTAGAGGEPVVVFNVRRIVIHKTYPWKTRRWGTRQSRFPLQLVTSPRWQARCSHHCTANLVNGKASFSTSSLMQGTHRILGSYSGDTNFNPNSAKPLVQVVNP